jgi:hypothetical protein
MPNKKILALVFTVVLLTANTVTAATNKNVTDQQMEQLLVKINTRMEQLQNQVNSLQSEVVHLKSQLRQQKSNNKVVVRTVVHSTQPQKYPPVPVEETAYGLASGTEKPAGVVAVHTAGEIPRKVVNGPENSNTSNRPQTGPIPPAPPSIVTNSDLGTKVYLIGTPVYSSPYIGIHSSYDGSDLIVNQSSVNFDVRLLHQQQALFHQLISMGYPVPQHPVLEISGKVEAQAVTGNKQPGTNDSSVDLSDAELDTFAEINPLVSGFLALEYDNSASSPIRLSNSRVFLRQGFINIGNFDYSPVFGTLGQFYLPFGQYSTYMLSAPLPEFIGRVRQRAIAIGYHPEQGFYGIGYVFQGDANVSSRTNGGINLGYKGSHGNLKTNFTVGLISDLAEAGGLQSTIAPGNFPFTGFGTSLATEKLVHSVPGFDAHASIGYNQYTFLAEYVTATRSFDVLDLNFNGFGAKPSALNLEGNYSFTLCDKPANFGIAYQITRQALAFLLPRDRYLAVFNISIWRDTIASLEFRHDVNYNGLVFASGAGGKLFGPQGPSSDNVLTAQFGVYF